MDLFYRKFGEGPPLIILHGLYGSSDNWVSIGKKLASFFEVYLIDQRNHGKSPHSPQHNYPLLKEDLREFMDKHSLDKAIIMGHSMGGKTAMYFAADYPERVSSLIVIDIAPGSYKGTESSQLITHSTIINAMYNVDFSKVNSRKEIEKVLAPSIPSKRVRQFLLKNAGRTRANRFAWRLNIETINNQLGNIMDGLDVEKFNGGNGITGFPVLFIKGEKSDYIGLEDEKAISTLFPYAEIETIPDTGHWLHAEKPERFLQTIQSFLGE
ncbi:MAG: alpha/beta fold hydrolase [Bacteroidales bacterium]|jgi:pimeloyl-ACP methyl ester carboxylesterase|nr:alpha/beta fold hydrolase [Bacteroidales bacterium]